MYRTNHQPADAARSRIHAPTIVAGIAVAIMAAGIVAAVVLVVGALAKPDARVVLVPCVTESDTNCYWDANLQGNGVGVSFVDIDGVAYYAGTGR